MNLPPPGTFARRCALFDACVLSVIGLWRAVELIRNRQRS